MEDGLSGRESELDVMIEGRVLNPGDSIHDLVDVIDEEQEFSEIHASGKMNSPEVIYDLVDVVEKRPKMAFVDPGLHEEIMRRAQEIADKVAREIIPEIAERVIREEIEKLKSQV